MREISCLAFLFTSFKSEKEQAGVKSANSAKSAKQKRSKPEVVVLGYSLKKNKCIVYTRVYK